ncbi:MAG: hypothetical protein NTW59_05140 [Candidatus Diapherotrites archaeon]|nr:hypothetical protein [Candidatus Diapherotrites archaeon]
MPYWNEMVTQRSWEKLQELKKASIRFTLIGGWAAWLYTKTHKSRDIDIIVDFEELGRLRELFGLSKNDRLHKYELRMEEIDVDVYVPHYSRLAMPLEEAAKATQKIEGFNVVEPEILLVLKQGAEEARKESEKGLKDRIDIMSLLLKAEMDFNAYNSLLQKHGLQHYKKRLLEIVQSFRETKYLDLNMVELKKKKQELLNKIKESK